MTKIIEFDDVYIELPDELVKEPNKEIDDEKNFESKTMKLSLEELQRKLEETQSLHL